MAENFYDDFRDLEVWQHCKKIRKQIWNLLKSFPVEEKYRLSDQLIRASRSSTQTKIAIRILNGYIKYLKNRKESEK